MGINLITMTTPNPTYKLEMLPTSTSRKVETFHFGKCREGLEGAYSYAQNCVAWRITCQGVSIDSFNATILDLQSLSVNS